MSTNLFNRLLIQKNYVIRLNKSKTLQNRQILQVLQYQPGKNFLLTSNLTFLNDSQRGFRCFQVKKNLLLSQKQKENVSELKDNLKFETDEKVDEPLRKRRRTLETGKNESPISKQPQKPLLLALKRRIFEKRQELDCLKSRNRCAKKVCYFS